MKNLIRITTALFLLVQTIGFSQTENAKLITDKQETLVRKENTKTTIDTHTFKDFIGEFFLAEADFSLEIVEENNEYYVISPFSKDLLIPTNENTLHEMIRGVDLERIAGEKNALKYTQNGYVTTIKRVNSKPGQ